MHDNILGANLSRCSNGGILRARVSRDLAARCCARFRVKCTDIDQAVNRLSGGNQQKVLLARWMATEPEVPKAVEGIPAQEAGETLRAGGLGKAVADTHVYGYCQGRQSMQQSSVFTGK